MNSMQIVASQDTTEEKDLNRHATFTTYISSTLFKNIIHTVNNIISILFSSQHYDGGDREYDETCRQIACSSDTKELLSNAKPLQKSKKKKNNIICESHYALAIQPPAHKRHHHIFNNIKLMSKEYIRIKTKTHYTLTDEALAPKDTHT